MFNILSFNLHLNLNVFFNSRLFFFFRIFKIFFKNYFFYLKFRKISRKYLIFFYMGLNNNCFKNLRGVISSKVKRCYIIHRFLPRNFYISYLKRWFIFHISAGMSKLYSSRSDLRRLRFLNNNYVNKIRKHFMSVYRHFSKFMCITYNGLSKRIGLSLKIYLALIRLFNGYLGVKWLRLFSLVLNRKSIFGYVRGERKPRRRKKIAKRPSLRYY